MKSAQLSDGHSPPPSGGPFGASLVATLANGGCLRVIILVGVLFGSFVLELWWRRSLADQGQIEPVGILPVFALSLVSLVLAWSQPLKLERKWRAELADLEVRHQAALQAAHSRLEQQETHAAEIAEGRRRIEEIGAQVDQVASRVGEIENLVRSRSPGPDANLARSKPNQPPAPPTSRDGAGKKPNHRK